MRIVWLLGFLVLPVLGMGYVLWHIWQLLPLPTLWKWIVSGAFGAMMLMMFAGFTGVIERLPLGAATAIYKAGNSQIIVLLYLALLFLLLDILVCLHLIPKSLLHDSAFTSVSIVFFMTALLSYGNWHYRNKYRQELFLSTNKTVSNVSKNDKKIILLSDLHLGYHNRRKEFSRWVDIINSEHPDLILIGGDIIDISTRPLLEENMAEEFRRLEAPVYACLGNHEYYSGEPKAQKFYEDAGITLLRDSVAIVDGINIIGRDDRTNGHRLSLRQLMEHTAPENYTILLDHQPYHLEEAEIAGVDFQFSGHTHYGQVWPISWLTRTMYEKSFGYLKKGNTDYYISSGMGIWGANYRIGTRSEYIVATLRTCID